MDAATDPAMERRRPARSAFAQSAQPIRLPQVVRLESNGRQRSGKAITGSWIREIPEGGGRVSRECIGVLSNPAAAGIDRPVLGRSYWLRCVLQPDFDVLL
jgi:hypothetical protein